MLNEREAGAMRASLCLLSEKGTSSSPPPDPHRSQDPVDNTPSLAPDIPAKPAEAVFIPGADKGRRTKSSVQKKAKARGKKDVKKVSSRSPITKEDRKEIRQLHDLYRPAKLADFYTQIEEGKKLSRRTISRTCLRKCLIDMKLMEDTKGSRLRVTEAEGKEIERLREKCRSDTVVDFRRQIYEEGFSRPHISLSSLGKYLREHDLIQDKRSGPRLPSAKKEAATRCWECNRELPIPERLQEVRKHIGTDAVSVRSLQRWTQRRRREGVSSEPGRSKSHTHTGKRRKRISKRL
ncbi:MAG: hypothetical protein OXF02_01340 [Simkaniaceae bacterium]|nr:hypothetical protein [Simkaniaceae bacterium]